MSDNNNNNNNNNNAYTDYGNYFIFFLKLTTGNLLEMIKYKITGLSFPSYSQAYHKNFNAIIEEPEKAPDWLIAGITYLIQKSGDSKEVRNYRPITCLTTTGIIAKRISTHLEE